MSARLGFGEIATAFESVAVARDLFLTTASRLYPRFQEDLLALADTFQELEFGFESELLSDGPLGEWCRRWNLKTGHKPAEWAVRAAYDSLAWYQDTVQFASPEFLWIVTCGGAVPNVPSGASRLRTRTLLAAKSETGRSKYPELSEALAKLTSEGWKASPTLKNEDHVSWTVEHVVGGLTHVEIAEKYFHDPLDPIGIAGNIRDQVSAFRKRMDWSPGQPAR